MTKKSYQHYPVTPKAEDRLEVVVHDKEGAMHQVRVIELSIGECEFLCPASNAHALHLGERVRLTFSAPVLDEPLGILARVVYRSEADEGRHYRVRFPQLGKLPSCIYTLFHRRSA